MTLYQIKNTYNHINALFIDAGGVLLYPDFKRIQDICKEYTPNDEQLDKALYVHGHIGAGLGPGDDDDKFVLNYALAAGISKKDIENKFDQLRNIVLFSPWIPRYLKQTITALNIIKKFIPKIVVVSNTEYGGVRDLLQRLEICQIGQGAGVEIHAVIDSAEIGIHKPDPEIYLYSSKIVGVPINKCAHIGDSIRNDVDSMNKAGGLGIHFCPYANCTLDTHLHITSLQDMYERSKNDFK